MSDTNDEVEDVIPLAASARKRAQYRSPNATYGNVAYNMAYAEAGALTRPAPGGSEVLRPRPKTRPRERAYARPKVKVREQGRVSVFAVVGFLAVGVFAALLLLSYVRLTVATDEVATLRTELTNLKKEESKLMAQYELAFDLSTIEAAVTSDGSMVKPQSDQIIILDMSEPDTVVRYHEEPVAEGGGILDQIKGVWAQVMEYFQ